MRIFVTLLAAAMLVGCQSKIAETFRHAPECRPCPPMGAIYDVARYVKFVDGGDETYPNIAYYG